MNSVNKSVLPELIVSDLRHAVAEVHDSIRGAITILEPGSDVLKVILETNADRLGSVVKILDASNPKAEGKI